jgi:hypothetical protein
MTISQEIANRGVERDVEDLIREDGSVDARQLCDVEIQRNDDGKITDTETRYDVSDEQCGSLRERLVDGETLYAVSYEYDISRYALRDHAIGECSCDTSVSPVENVGTEHDPEWVSVD